MLRGRVAGDALAQQVQLALALRDEPLAPVELLQPLVHDVAESLDFLPEIGALKVGPQRLELVTPARGILADDRAVLARPAPGTSVSRK